MASFNITLEDHSPLITYAPAGAWTDTPANGSLASDYSDASFHTTSAQDASATIQFNGAFANSAVDPPGVNTLILGTGISIFGGKRSNYGTFKLTVDGNTITEASAASSSSSTKQLLASASGLEDGPHTAVFTHAGGGAIDIDSAVLEARVGSGSLRLTQKDIDDSDSSITYAPATSWNTNSRPEFINNTLRFTSSPDATASMSFFGDAVAIYGTVAPDHSDFQITLDGKQTTLRGGAGGMVRTLRPKSLLYFASNLGLQDHQISLQSVSTENAPFLDLDGITVYSAVKTNNNQASPSSAAPTDSQAAPPSNTVGVQGAQASKATSKTTIIAAAVGGGLGFLLLLALGLFLFFRRRQRQRRAYVDDDLSPKSPHLPIQKPRFSEAPSTIANRWSFQTPFVPQSRVTSVASSYESTAPMMKDVPIIKPPSPARMSNTSSAVGSNRPMRAPYTPGTPSRPARPPTLNYDYWDGGPEGQPSRAV
ncbi:hypothetical protein CCMSSC00406_0003842 [Pleurotus cornucopiae]|uniref:Uncharacterized protein n=1 Tax=Pleurotus cornucopiae TaxID=5321 RepID=A0ACB7ISY2_PLECO|nr:hypothetical protein CCMSSC00406_0003842 [Pleurotus cornucopiae]